MCLQDIRTQSKPGSHDPCQPLSPKTFNHLAVPDAAAAGAEPGTHLCCISCCLTCTCTCCSKSSSRSSILHPQHELKLAWFAKGSNTSFNTSVSLFGKALQVYPLQATQLETLTHLLRYGHDLKGHTTTDLVQSRDPYTKTRRDTVSKAVCNYENTLASTLIISGS